MKCKKYFYLILLKFCFISLSIHAQTTIRDQIDIFGIHAEAFELRWTFGTMDFIMDYSNNLSFTFKTNLIYIIFEEHKTRLGIEIDPINYSFNNDIKEHILSFWRFNVFWNIFKPNMDGLWFRKFGPFIGFDLFDSYNFNDFYLKRIYTVGFRYSLDGSIFRLFCFEAGYQNTNNKHGAYIGVKLIRPLAFFLLGMQ